jgi:CRISPR/Cas system CSM-associated protein Csm2 small subunit
MVSDSKMLLLLILGMVRDQLSEEETIEYLSRAFTIEEIEESESALNFAELTEEHKDKMRDFFDKVKQQIQKNNDWTRNETANCNRAR